MIFYGHNCTRPGISPPQWYGVIHWRTTRTEALADQDKMVKFLRDLEDWSRTRDMPNLIRSQHRIEVRKVNA